MQSLSSIKTLKKPRSPFQKLWLMNLISKAKEKSHCVQVQSTHVFIWYNDKAPFHHSLALWQMKTDETHPEGCPWLSDAFITGARLEPVIKCCLFLSFFQCLVSLYYSLSLRTEAGKRFSVFWCSAVSTWPSSHSDSPLLLLAFSRSRTILSLHFPFSCIEY